MGEAGQTSGRGGDNNQPVPRWSRRQKKKEASLVLGASAERIFKYAGDKDKNTAENDRTIQYRADQARGETSSRRDIEKILRSFICNFYIQNAQNPGN